MMVAILIVIGLVMLVLGTWLWCAFTLNKEFNDERDN